MRFEVVFVLMFSLVTAVAILTRWLRIPYTVALVIAGLVLGTMRIIEPPRLTKELLYSIFLPGLIFEAAFHIDYKEYWRNKLAIHALAVPGVVVAMALTALLLIPAASALHLADGLQPIHALVFGALISATDPIAVVALFKTLGAPKRLAVLIESESLLNDGTAVVFFTLILGLASGNGTSLGGVALDFVLVVGVGALIGLAFGYAAARLARRIEDAMIAITLTTLAAYGSFVVAEHFHYSGVIATVAAGMVFGNFSGRAGLGHSVRLAVHSFWEYVVFAMNSVVFLLIGFEVRLSSLLHAWQAILAAYLAMTLGRVAVIYLVTLLLRRSRERIPWRWSLVLTWGGLRGGLSMVLVLGLPLSFPFRDFLVTITFGVVLLTILIQGLTLSPLLRRLGIVVEHSQQEQDEVERGRARAARAALLEVQNLARAGSLHAEAAAALVEEYSQLLNESEQRLKEGEKGGKASS